MAAEQDPEGRAAARPLLTDLYQVTMALGYWRAGRASAPAEFELFFRQSPFGGAFALAAGLRDCVRFLRAFRLLDAGTRRPGARHQGPPQTRPSRATGSGTPMSPWAALLPQPTRAFVARRRAVPGLGAAPRHRPRVLRAPPGP